MKIKKPQKNARKAHLPTNLIAFLIGAGILSVFSGIQKVIMHEEALILKPQSYFVPVIYGGVTGLLLGQWYLRLKQKESELLEQYNATLTGWAKAVELRDKNTQDHTERVINLTEKLARAMGVPQKELVQLRRGALLHDIGKIGVPDAILNKPGVLTEEERAIMQQHPIRARELLETVKFLSPAIEIPCCHHELWNGSGYPKGLKGEEIPFAARIFTVIDVWDALVHDRPYRKAWSTKEAIAYIEQNAGILFDPKVVRVFLANTDQWLGEYSKTSSDQK